MAEFDGRVDQTTHFVAPLPVQRGFDEASATAARRPGLRLDFVAKALLIALCCAVTGNWVAHRIHKQPGITVAERGFGKIHDGAEHAIFLGGIVLERNRHAIAGGTLGCATGAALGAGAATAAGFFTAGAGFAAIPSASIAGCALAGLGGVVMGYPLDDYVNF
jgi:hypothetical protein